MKIVSHKEFKKFVKENNLKGQGNPKHFKIDFIDEISSEIKARIHYNVLNITAPMLYEILDINYQIKG